MTAAVDDARLAQHWLDNAIPRLKAAPDPIAWVLENRQHLARVDRYVPNGLLSIQAVIAERQEASSP